MFEKTATDSLCRDVGLIFLIYENASNYLVFIVLFPVSISHVHNNDTVMPAACVLRNSEECDGSTSKFT